MQAGNLGKHDEAIDLWHRYLEDEHTDRLELAYMNLGHVHLEAGHIEESAAASRQALQRAPEMKEACFNLAIAELCAGRAGECTRILEGLLSRSPDYVPALALLAGTRYLAGDSERFARTLEQLKGLEANPAVFLQTCAARLRRLGRDEDAARLTDAARRIWSELLASRGVAASDEQIEELMALGDAAPAPG